jgi:lipopolysaccharide export system ATP-binding protein
MNRKARKYRQDELLGQFGLTHIRKTKANRVSGGERRRLEIARSLITEPKLILLDEPFAGIDPKTVGEIQDAIRDLAERYNLAILITDHQFRETLEVTDRTYVIREGRVFAYGDRESIINNADVRRYYIGERFDVGHLLDKRHRHELPGPQSPAGHEGEASLNQGEDQLGHWLKRGGEGSPGIVEVDMGDDIEDEDGDDPMLV